MRRVILASTALLVVMAFGAGWFLGWFEAKSDGPDAFGVGGRARVCLHGKMIQPPYDVEYDEDLDEVTINGISIHREPAVVPEIEVTQDAIDQLAAHNLLHRHLNEELDGGATRDEALESCVEVAEGEACIASAKLVPEGFLVEWAFGPTELFAWKHEVDEPLTEDELAERVSANRKELATQFRRTLDQGRYLFVHSEGQFLSDPADVGRERVEKIRFQLSRDVDRDAMIYAISKQMLSESLARDIVDAQEEE